MRRILSLFLLTALTAAACGDGTTNGVSGLPDPTSSTVASINLDDVVFASALIPFTACDDMLTYLQTEASSRVGAYGLGGGGYYGPGILEIDLMSRDSGFGNEATSALAPAMTFAASEGDSTPQQGVDFSGTNVQELGIDEPDLIKTDGQRILVVSGNTLHYIDVSGSEAALTDSITLDGHWSNNILFSDNRAFVLASTEAGEGSVNSAATSRLLGPDMYWKALTSVIEIDLSDPHNLAVTSTMTVEGNYVSARVINGVARVVITTGMNQLPFVYPQNEAGEENAKKFNQEIITSTVIEDWLPSYVLETSDGAISDGLLSECSNVHHPSEFAGFSTLNVLTVDLGAALVAPSSTTILADGQTVYAGGTNLYVATTSYVDPILFENSNDTFWQELEENYATSIHQFDVSDTAATTYLASGSVEGNLLNQFSMSEHNGHLRVATTKGSPWRGFSEDSESMVTVLQRDEAELKTVGQVGDMGAGERIYSVRFVGDVGYVVTFRQTDPFYTVDLSDPTNPVVRGELKINGYSGYLHPLDNGLVLGIGQEATDTGQTTGTKVTLFDANDLDNPVALDTWTTEGGNSSVEWDHRAFLWWGPENLALLPFNDWSTSYSGAAALHIVDGTITEVGRIDHDDEPGETPVDPPCPVIDEDLLNFDRPEWMSDQELTIMVCDSYDIDFGGQECEIISAEEAAMYGEEYGISSDLTLLGDSTIAICWPSNYDWMPTIERSLIIGDQLWTYSMDRLQANDLATLNRQQVVKL
ncbi:MAG TPA: hypothetical protein EYG34_05465 [Acidimicrobiia bacterium]|jgi:uncharacterized secreted protein with C-terminal beta-propeller domain|nr:hypothetical protein [Acidimicrobiia bacterium]HIL46550.1 hypothetical protein [Acidimicrobiia bacterium]